MVDTSNGKLDIGLKISIGLAASLVGAAAIALPNNKQKEAAALELFNQPMGRLVPQDRKAAEFYAAHKRWTDFFQNKVYPLTRKLPGASTPLLNPYRDQEFAMGQADDDE